MAALAARYPSVAAALTEASLTGEQHDQYRAALVSAMVTETFGERATGAVVDPASALGKNIAFLRAHPEALKALEEASSSGRVKAGIFHVA